jgi:hypothetical protein
MRVTVKSNNPDQVGPERSPEGASALPPGSPRGSHTRSLLRHQAYRKLTARAVYLVVVSEPHEMTTDTFWVKMEKHAL